MGTTMQSVGHDVYLRAAPVEAVGLVVFVLGYQGRAVFRAFAGGYKGPLHPFARPLAEKVLVKWVDRVLLFSLLGPLRYRVVLSAGAVNLAARLRVFVRPRLPRRVPLIDLYRQNVGGNFAAK